MSPRIFITGISGYIGGQILHDLSIKHPDFETVGLVRNEEQAQKVKTKYPTVQIVLGDLASHDVLLEEAKKADVVVNAADCDNVPAVKTLIEGLSQGKKGPHIQLSGAASTLDFSSGLGNASKRVYDDIEDCSEMATFDSTHIHWEADQTVLKEGKALGIKTAILIPPAVFGLGEGPIKNKSMQLPWLVDAIVKRGKGFTVGEGKSIYSGIHIKDLSEVFIFFIEQGLKPDGGKATWGGPESLYYVESGQDSFDHVARESVKLLAAKGLIKSTEIDKLDVDEAKSVHPWAEILWGSNMRCRASRLRALGWKPAYGSMDVHVCQFLD